MPNCFQGFEEESARDIQSIGSIMKCIVELVGDDPNGRKMIAWGRRIGCADAGHGFDPSARKVVTKLLVDDSVPSQQSYLLELVDNPVGLRAINPV